MNYIGSKYRLSPWIKQVIQGEYSDNINKAIFADIFAGTGQVARTFKSTVEKVIVNDLEYYSFVLNKHYIGNTTKLEKPVFKYQSKKGIIYNNFSPASNIERMYFTETNAKKIDGIRFQIEQDFQFNLINEQQYFWLLASLLEASDEIANTASVYGAFLKKFKKRALNELDFKLLDYEITNQKNEVYQQNASHLIHNIKGDVLYLDPPYNQRQYGSNYHVLNRIAQNTDFNSNKKTGIIDYEKSAFCNKRVVFDEFETLIKAADFPYIFISYNNEGIISSEQFKSMLEQFGKYKLFQKEYKTFKTDSKRQNKSEKTFEHLHVLKKI